MENGLLWRVGYGQQYDMDVHYVGHWRMYMGPVENGFVLEISFLSDIGDCILDQWRMCFFGGWVMSRGWVMSSIGHWSLYIGAVENGFVSEI